MNGWNYVAAGYIIVFLTLAVYAYYIVSRGRKLSQNVPPERRRFLD